MPCANCRITFKIEPCKHDTGIMKDDQIPLGKFIHKDSVSTFKTTVITLYKNLHDKCPCKECLVNMVCQQGPQCPSYHNIIVESSTYLKTIEEK